MSEIKDGGPAFPQNDAVVNRINNEAGMSLRDYFAAKALPQVLATYGFDTTNAASTAYGIADAMLAKRERKS